MEETGLYLRDCKTLVMWGIVCRNFVDMILWRIGKSYV